MGILSLFFSPPALLPKKARTLSFFHLVLAHFQGGWWGGNPSINFCPPPLPFWNVKGLERGRKTTPFLYLLQPPLNQVPSLFSCWLFSCFDFFSVCFRKK